MKALRLHGPHSVRLEEVPDPRPGKGWVLIETRLVGICGTDKAFYKGSYKPPKLPLIPGHEAVGVVIDGPEELRGRRVVTEINLVLDWNHPVCRLGMYTHCPPSVRRVLGIDFDGAMAEYFLSKPEALHIVEELSDEQAIFVEPLAAVLRTFKLKPLKPLSHVAVIGAGPIALLAAQVARLHGANVTAVLRSDSPKRSFFKELGFSIVAVNEAEETAKSVNGGLGFDAVVEATGTPEGLKLALKLVRPLGTVYTKSTHGMPVEIDQTRLVVNEVALIGSRCGTWREFEEAIDLLAKNLVKVRVTAVYSLDKGVEAFEKSLERKAFKVAVKP